MGAFSQGAMLHIARLPAMSARCIRGCVCVLARNKGEYEPPSMFNKPEVLALIKNTYDYATTIANFEA